MRCNNSGRNNQNDLSLSRFFCVRALSGTQLEPSRVCTRWRMRRRGEERGVQCWVKLSEQKALSITPKLFVHATCCCVEVFSSQTRARCRFKASLENSQTSFSRCTLNEMRTLKLHRGSVDREYWKTFLFVSFFSFRRVHPVESVH